MADLHHLPCPCGKSSDAFSIYEDTGFGNCFSGNCDRPNWSPKRMEEAGYDFTDSIVFVSSANSGHNVGNDAGSVDPEFDRRGLSDDTFDRYGVQIKDDRTEWPIYSPENTLHAVKTRIFPKRFKVDGSLKGAGLFGRNVFPAGSSKTITVTEGYEDALAAYQMQGSKYPCVSIHGSASAVADCRADFEYLNSFETIVLCFDNDDAGRKAAQKVSEVLPFPVGKLKILWLSKGKDASDYSREGWARDFQSEWWKAEVYKPDGIRLGAELWQDIIDRQDSFSVPYPWEGLNQKTYGIRLSELVIVTADTGVGKTAVLKAIEHSILTNKEATERGYGVGLMHLEETNGDTALGIISIHNGTPYHLPDVARPEADLRKAFDEVIGTGRLVLWDHFGSNDIDGLLAKVRHMYAMGCRYIVLDHLSIVVSDQSGDERKQLDEITTKLKTLTMELDISIIAVIHTNRNGQIRGTAGVEQLANIVIRLERDKIAASDWRRNIMKVSVEKNRFCGYTGPACYLQYDPDTARLSQLPPGEVLLYEQGEDV